MKKKSALSRVSDDQVSRLVLQLRGHKVMLDSDLAALYGVPTHRLNESVKRNIERFPEDFMFQLTHQEVDNLISQIAISSLEDNQSVRNLRSQIATSSLINKNNQIVDGSIPRFTTKNDAYGGRRKLPYAFTEQGVAMLSSVLRSPRAVQMNIAIMRAFVSLRGMMRSQDTIKQELASLKRQYKDHDNQIKTIFLLIDEIMAPPPLPKKHKIGFI